MCSAMPSDREFLPVYQSSQDSLSTSMPVDQLPSSDRVWNTSLRPGSAPAALSMNVLCSFGKLFSIVSTGMELLLLD